MNRVHPEATVPERRFVDANIELRQEQDGESSPTVRRLVGYAAVFDRPALIGSGPSRFLERVARGAFAKTIQEADIRLLVNHDPNHVLARTRSGTLRLSEDEIGLRVEAELDTANDPEAAMWARRVERGDITQMSFGFEVIQERWDLEADPPERTLLEVRLWDVSLVTFPAYVDTVAHVRMDERVRQALESRGVVPADVSDRTAPEDTPWSAPTLSDFTDGTWEELSDAQKRRIAGHFAWAPEVPPERFTDLKLPHHRPEDGAVVWRGVAAAMAALLGARGGVSIPSQDRRRVYNHLAAHYRQFDREPPEFSEASWFPAPRAGEEPPEAARRLRLVRVRSRFWGSTEYDERSSTVEIRELYERAQSIYREMRAILDAAEEEGRDLTAEELERYDRLEGELERVIEQRQALEKASRYERLLEESKPVVEADEEQRAFRAYLRYGASALSETERRALGVGTDTLGGYLVPDTMARDLVRVIDRFSAMRQVVTPVVTQSGEDLLIPVSDDTANVGTIVAENTQVAEQDTTFDQKRLVAYKYASKLVKVSLELLTDAAYPVEQRLFELLGERIGRAIEQHYIAGTGTNQPQGITNAPVGKTTAANNAITYDELVDFVHSLDPAYRANAVIILHDSTVKAIRKLKDSSGQPLWQPSMRDEAPGTILGYRYVTSPYMPEMASQAVVAAIGDFRAGYIIRDVRGIELVRSDRALIDYYQIHFNAWFRTGGLIQNTKAIRTLKMAL